MNKEEIGIGILDIYSSADLINCFNSIPEEFKNNKNLLIISDTKNRTDIDYPIVRIGTGIQMASLRNWLVSQFRINGIKHIFLINSNQIIKNPNIFEETIQKAEIFGTWFMSGPEKVIVTLEDDKSNNSLTLSNILNSDFIYFYTGIINNIGYFDEKYFNTKDLDVVDFIIKMREKNIYPPNHYYPMVSDGVESSNSKIEKNNHTEILSDDKSIQMAYGYFFFKNKYIPKQNEPPAVSQEQLINAMEEIQKNYGKKSE